MARDGWWKLSFHASKECLREYVTAIRFENIIKEILLKVSLYNWFQSITVT